MVLAAAPAVAIVLPISWLTDSYAGPVDDDKVGRACAFCGRTAPEIKLTKEHVLSQGLRRALKAADTEAVVRYGTFGAREAIQRDAAGFSIRPDILRQVERAAAPNIFDETVRVVCADCNSGWMSTIDAVAQPLLIAMAAPEPYRLPYGKRAVVAAWALLKIIMCQYFFPPTQQGADTALRKRFWSKNEGRSTPWLPADATVWGVSLDDLRAHGTWAYGAHVRTRAEEYSDVVGGRQPWPAPDSFGGILGLEHLVFVGVGQSTPHALPTGVQQLFSQLPGTMQLWPASPQSPALLWPPADTCTLERLEAAWAKFLSGPW